MRSGALVVLSVLVSFLLTGCGAGIPMRDPAYTPVLTPGSGTYIAPPQVTITTPRSGARIVYTTDGTPPTVQSTPYTGPVTVQQSETVQAVAIVGKYIISGTAVGHYTLHYAAPTISATSYDFSVVAKGSTAMRTVAVVQNNAPAPITLNETFSGSPDFSAPTANSAGTGGPAPCGSSIAAGASCSLVLQFVPSTSGPESGGVTLNFGGNTAGTAHINLMGTGISIPNVTIAPTSNPLVASYTIKLDEDATVAVEFGTDTSYGRVTSTASIPQGGGSVTVYVAGMRADTVYHMRARITTASGTAFAPDETFTTGSLPASLAAVQMQATTAAGHTPQPGVEIVDPVTGKNTLPYATDLQGNIIWFYPWTDRVQPFIMDGFRPMPNGDFLVVIGAVFNSAPTNLPNLQDVLVREIDLVGNTVREISVSDLNTRLGVKGYNLKLTDFHHDAYPLPNGHWLVLANTFKTVDGQTVIGDVVVDLDEYLNPDFVWNEFDHFDTNRRPMLYPDWTHSNAVIYSPQDGNFIVSLRHQSWVVKVNFQNGNGDGSVLWKLGYQGDFKLIGGTDPTDWQFAQHGPSLVSNASKGTFQMVMMDNGNNRITTSGGICGLTGDPQCYSTVPIFQIDENAMTATIVWRDTPAAYNPFGGNAEVLANGDVEYDLCGLDTSSEIDERTQDANQSLVWSLKVTGDNVYRGYRVPSLYPGVQW